MRQEGSLVPGTRDLAEVRMKAGGLQHHVN